MSEDAAIDALDELLQLDLVRSTDVPRRFRFRHPLVRRALYEGTAAGWRLGAHQRCAAALAGRGAKATARANHVARSARQGDLAAVAVLREAGEAALRLAPASAARWYADALRLLPETAPARDRVDLLVARAGALTASGHFGEGHDALTEALDLAPAEPPSVRARIVRACAALEANLGQQEQARIRLSRELEHLADHSSPEAVALRIELAMNALWRAEYGAMYDSAQLAVSAARRLGDPPLIASALAVLAFADSMRGAAGRAEADRLEAVAVVDSLSDDELARRLDAAAWISGAELYLDRYADADRHASRALEVGRATGQGELFLVLVQTLSRVWYVRGKLAEAIDLLDGGIEAARLLGNTQSLAWNLFNRSVYALAVGDLEGALATAEESVELTENLKGGFHAAWAGVRLASALLESGRAEEAAEMICSRAGGEQIMFIPGSSRAYCLELLTRCWLALGRLADAQRAARSARDWAAAVQLPLAGAWADRATAAVALQEGDAASAGALALRAASVADEVGAPIEAALSRTLAGRALAEVGDADRAVAQLERAARTLDACGATRFRDAAERELRRLGRRIHRRTRPGKAGAGGVDALTARELQVARLVVDRKTNAEIAAELFLSLKTVETHLRNIFHKLDVTSRVALARAVERADAGGDAAAPTA